jgi:hypothetical protein
LKDNSGSGEVDPIDIRKAYKRNVLEGYSKNNPKNKIMKYKQLPQENIMEEKVEEDILDSEIDRTDQDSLVASQMPNRKYKKYNRADFE